MESMSSLKWLSALSCTIKTALTLSLHRPLLIHFHFLKIIHYPFHELRQIHVIHPYSVPCLVRNLSHPRIPPVADAAGPHDCVCDVYHCYPVLESHGGIRIVVSCNGDSKLFRQV